MLFIPITFLLGIGNFAVHLAVLRSGHAMVKQIPWFQVAGGKLSLTGEFLVLLGALLLVAQVDSVWGWAYLGYSALNGLAAWAILTGRV